MSREMAGIMPVLINFSVQRLYPRPLKDQAHARVQFIHLRVFFLSDLFWLHILEYVETRQ